MRGYRADARHDDQQALEAKKILDDPPDRHFKQVAKPRAVHPKKIAGVRFKAFNSFIADCAGRLAGTHARDIRKSGERRAQSQEHLGRQAPALRDQALRRKDHRPLAPDRRAKESPDEAAYWLHAKGHPGEVIVVDFSDLIAGNVDLAAAMRPSAR